MRLEGIIPQVTTPFDETGDLLLGDLEANLLAYRERPLGGWLVLGSNGESVHLTSSEQKEIVALAARLSGEQPLIVGISSPCTRLALERMEDLFAPGVDAFLVSTPAYFKNRMTAAALHRHFTDLAAASPCPLLLYNVPQYSGLELDPVLVAELASHPRIVGMKDSSGNLIYLQRVLEASAGKQFQVVLGSAQVLAPALTLGVRAAILAVACSHPELPHAVLSAAGKDAALQRLLFQLSEAVTTRYGVVGLKLAMDLVGFRGGHCRLPLLPLDSAGRSEIERLVAEVGRKAAVEAG